MTTIIGVNAKDPDFLEPYTMLFSDSKGSDGSINNIKLYSPENCNYIVGVAGKILNHYFSKKDEFAKRILSEGMNLTESQLESILSGMNLQMSSEIGETNNYLVAMQEEIPKLLHLFGDSLKPAGRYFAQGSGREFTKTLDELRNYFVGDDLVIAKRDVIELGVEALKEAASKDEGTGGFTSFGIITPSFKNVVYNHSRID